MTRDQTARAPCWSVRNCFYYTHPDIRNIQSISEYKKYQNNYITPFDSLIMQFANATGLPIEIATDNSCTLEAEGITITLQYRQECDDIAFFSPVAMQEQAAGFSHATLKRALELSFNGIGTHGGFLGIFDDSLILTSYMPLHGMDADTLATRILAFADTAQGIALELADASERSEGEFADHRNTHSLHEALIRI